MIVLIGASASGKTELAKILCNSYGFKKCITTTTRLIRENERNNIDYHFISKETFKIMDDNDEFIGVTNYHENLYGIQKNDLVLNGVLIVDPSGANSLIDTMKQELFVVFIESSEKLRRLRMIKRGDTTEIIKKRLASDNLLFQPKHIKRIDLLIKNEDDSLTSLAELIYNEYTNHLNLKKVERDIKF